MTPTQRYIPLNETTPVQRQAIVEAASNPELQNETVAKRRVELILELRASVRPGMDIEDLRRIHMMETLLLEAEKPARKRPPIDLKARS
jgi:hypothetical protein